MARHAGGLAPEETRWISCRSRFFLPVRVLGALFRGKYLALLERSFHSKTLRFHGRLEALADPAAFARLLREVRRTRWVVYAKPPFGGPERVLKYLARYTHRIAISNARLLCATEQAVTFTWKDYRHDNRHRQMRLAPCEFIRRFLLHALPKGFVRIRRFGLLANCRRETRLARCRALLEKKHTGVQVPEPSRSKATEDVAGRGTTPMPRERRCRACGQGRLHRVRVLHPLRDPWCRAPPAGPSA